MRTRLVGVLVLVLLVVPVSEASAGRTRTYRDVADTGAYSAVTDVAGRQAGVAVHGVRFVPRSSKIRISVDDVTALDGQSVYVTIRQPHRTVLAGCIPVRKDKVVRIARSRPTVLHVHALPACGTARCRPVTSASIPTPPACAEAAPYANGTAGTVTIRG